MDIDWEVEVGGGAPVIEADWAGFIDLRTFPERVSEIAEAAAFPPLSALLLSLNGPQSTVWTSKCDLWEPEPAALACYVDLLPRATMVFRRLHDAEAFCRRQAFVLDPWTSLAATAGPETMIALPSRDSDPDASLTYVIRQAMAAGAEGYGVTIYLAAEQSSANKARQTLAAAMAAVAGALSRGPVPANVDSKLK